MNQVVLVGKVLEVSDYNSDELVSVIVGVEETNEYFTRLQKFQIFLWENLAEDFKAKLKEGMHIGVKGRLSDSNHLSDGKVTYHCNVIAEKVTLLEA